MFHTPVCYRRMADDRSPDVGVGAVAILNGESVLLVKRGHEPSKGLWSLPGGRVVHGETLAEALRREIREETGLEVEVGEVAGIVERHYPEQGLHYVIIDYFVTVIGGKLRAGEDAEDARWVPLNEIESLDLVPRLVEALRDFGVLQSRQSDPP